MADWTVARVKNPDTDKLPEIYQKFQIKRNGVYVADLEYKSRWKNAGGPAWRVLYFHYSHPHMTGGCVGITWWNKNRAKVLQEMKANCERLIKN